MSGHLYVETARPKVNLTLRVLGRRADGYHALESLVAFADGLGDRVVLDCGELRGIAVSGPFAGGIAGANLCDTVMELVAQAAAGHPLRLGHVHLEKNLPVAAGIGGGSADAGALLRALQRANPDLLDVVDWQAIAARLGADVPVCLLNQAAWMTGIGEHLTPLATLPELGAVLVNPQVPVPGDKTAQVFRALRAGPLDESSAPTQVPPAIANADALIALIDGGNDLEAAARAVIPAIGDVLSALRAMPGCRVAAMSGAGPTCFGVFADPEAAAEDLARRHPAWWVRPAKLS